MLRLAAFDVRVRTVISSPFGLPVAIGSFLMVSHKAKKPLELVSKSLVIWIAY